MNRNYLIACGVVVGGITAWGVYCLFTTRSFNPFAGTAEPPEPSPVAGRPGMYRDETLEAWLNSPNECKYTAPHADAHAVELAYPRDTAPFKSNADTGNREVRRAMFRFLRDAMRDAGRGDEDVRCMMLRTAIESGWIRRGRSFYFNMGNIKAQNHVWSTSRADAKAGRNLKCDIGDSAVIFILKDRLRSTDGYPGFRSLGDYLRFDKRVLERRYPAALAGYRRGGKEGAVEAETSFGRGGYSSEGTVSRLATLEGYWLRQRVMFGEAWNSREAFNAYLDGASLTVGR